MKRPPVVLPPKPEGSDQRQRRRRQPLLTVIDPIAVGLRTQPIAQHLTPQQQAHLHLLPVLRNPVFSRQPIQRLLETLFCLVPALLPCQQFTGTKPVPTQRRIHPAAALLKLQSLSIMSLLLSQLAKKMQRRTMLRVQRNGPLQQRFSRDPMALLPSLEARAVELLSGGRLVHGRRPMRALT